MKREDGEGALVAGGTLAGVGVGVGLSGADAEGVGGPDREAKPGSDAEAISHGGDQNPADEDDEADAGDGPNKSA